MNETSFPGSPALWAGSFISVYLALGGFETKVKRSDLPIVHPLSNETGMPAHLNRCTSLPGILFKLLGISFVLSLQQKKPLPEVFSFGIAARLSISLTSRDIRISLDPDSSNWTELGHNLFRQIILPSLAPLFSAL